jgi:hypothetical protein
LICNSSNDIQRVTERNIEREQWLQLQEQNLEAKERGSRRGKREGSAELVSYGDLFSLADQLTLGL